MTFSIVARAADSTLFGMAIASSSPAVAARCAHARAGVGVVASQNITDPALGQGILDRLAGGAAASQALPGALAATSFAAYRQVLALGRSGPPAGHSGEHALGIVGLALGEHAAAAGNLLADADVPRAMLEAFDAAEGHLGQRLLHALRAGAGQGGEGGRGGAAGRRGEAGPIHSAGLVVVRDVSWPIVDLRVDWSPSDPVGDLEKLWEVYAPQIEDYVRRALDPRTARSFGVPGDL